MSDPKKRRMEECEQENEGSFSKKPRHVRKLQFGQTILGINTVSENLDEYKDGRLVINEDLANIPCTDKNVLVRKWIETHNQSAAEWQADESRFDESRSPDESGSGAIRRTTISGSPIIGKSRKYFLKRRKLKRALQSQIMQRLNDENNFGNPACCKESMVEENKHTRETRKVDHLALPLQTSNVQEFSTLANMVMPVCSPVQKKIMTRETCKLKENDSRVTHPGLVANSSMDANENCIVSTNSNIDAKMHSPLSPPLLRKRKKYVKRKGQCFQRMYLNLSDNSSGYTETKDQCELEYILPKSLAVYSNLVNTENFGTIETTGLQSRVFSPILEPEKEFDIEDSPERAKGHETSEKSLSRRSNAKAAKDSRCSSDACDGVEPRGGKRDKINVDTDDTEDTERTTSFLIEAVTSDDSAGADKIICPSTQDRVFDLPVNNMVESGESEKHFDAKYYRNSKTCTLDIAGESESKPSSQAISSGTTITKELGQSAAITAPTTPSHSQSNPDMMLTVVDSGKKKLRAKKGTMLARLQSLINSNMSFVRMWRHQIRQLTEENNGSHFIPHVTVYVHECTTLPPLSQQFFEGSVVDDSFNLLPPPEPDEPRSTHSQSCRRTIRIYTTPVISGKVEMKSGYLIQIAPPWRVISGNNLTLDVTYINTPPAKKAIDAKEYERRIKKHKEIVYEASEYCCAHRETKCTSCLQLRAADYEKVMEELIGGL